MKVNRDVTVDDGSNYMSRFRLMKVNRDVTVDDGSNYMSRFMG